MFYVLSALSQWPEPNTVVVALPCEEAKVNAQFIVHFFKRVALQWLGRAWQNQSDFLNHETETESYFFPFRLSAGSHPTTSLS